jgi:hypothetical protein
MLISWKPPEVVSGTIGIVSTLPAGKSSVAALPEMTMSRYAPQAEPFEKGLGLR